MQASDRESSPGHRHSFSTRGQRSIARGGLGRKLPQRGLAEAAPLRSFGLATRARRPSRPKPTTSPVEASRTCGSGDLLKRRLDPSTPCPGRSKSLRPSARTSASRCALDRFTRSEARAASANRGDRSRRTSPRSGVTRMRGGLANSRLDQGRHRTGEITVKALNWREMPRFRRD